jgi:hypothetical protein
LNILELSVELVIKPMKIVFQDPTFLLQLLRTISESYSKGVDIGE